MHARTGSPRETQCRHTSEPVRPPAPMTTTSAGVSSGARAADATGRRRGARARRGEGPREANGALAQIAERMAKWGASRVRRDVTM